MFARAYSIATQFTQPIITSTRHEGGSVKSGPAAFVIVNSDGWILTAAHVMNSFMQFKRDAKERQAFEEQTKAIREDSALSPKAKQKRLAKLQRKREWITNHSFWWGRDGVRISDITADPVADLAIGQLQPFEPSWVEVYPTFKDPSKPMSIGTSLCRLGFPFHEIRATFDEATGNFGLEPGALPVPFFPIEGIYTRNAVIKKNDRAVQFLETSSPGLRGQSGGPIFDVNGVVWAIQSRTAHLPLGFSPKVKKGGREVEEHQFINVGLGAHVQEVVRILSDHKIAFSLADY
jgi:hypothetical protein